LRLDEIASTKRDTEDIPDVQKYIAGLDPALEEPTHLTALTSAFERLDDGEVIREAWSVPPRHWKTTTILGAVARKFETTPGYRVAYFTYSHPQAERKSRDAQRYVARRGMKLGDRRTFAEWTTSNGCLFRAAGLIGGATGDGFDLIIVDDPYRSRADAESPTIRARTQESFEADVYTRQQNTPTSFIVVHTRWHTEDLINEISEPDFQDGYPFTYTNLPAIDPLRSAPEWMLDDDYDGPEYSGELLPKYWPTSRLRPFMSNRYEFESQFQGNPIPRGSTLFNTPIRCDLSDLPTIGRDVIGIDCAYSEKTKSDWTTYVVLRKALGRVWVMEAARWQLPIEQSAQRFKALAGRFPGAPMVWHAASGPEKDGVGRQLIVGGVPVRIEIAAVDKFVRALPLSSVWNRAPEHGEHVVVPYAPWARDYVKEMERFVGKAGGKDDYVDASTSGFWLLDGAADDSRVESYGRRRMDGARDSY